MITKDTGISLAVASLLILGANRIETINAKVENVNEKTERNATDISSIHSQTEKKDLDENAFRELVIRKLQRLEDHFHIDDEK